MVILGFLIIIGVFIMVLYINGQKIKEVYKGSTPIKEIYKGDKLVYQKGGNLALILGDYYSFDAVNWEQITKPSSDTYIIKIINNRIFAIKSGETAIYETKDLVNWTLLSNMSKKFEANLFNTDDLFYLNGYYIHSKYNSSAWEKSSDLVNWSNFTGVKLNLNGGGASVASNGDKIAIYYGGISLGGGSTQLAYTNDGGSSWTTISSVVYNRGYLNGYFFKGDYLYKSTNGSSWSHVGDGTFIGYCNDKYIRLIENNTTGYYSLDSDNWVGFSLPKTDSYMSCFYFNNKYYYICSSGSNNILLYKSTDLTNWETEQITGMTTFWGGRASIVELNK